MSIFRAIPSASPFNTSSIADLAEAECLKAVDGNVSTLQIERIIDRADDESSPRNETTKNIVVESFNELAARALHCGAAGERYPFRVVGGNLLEVRPAIKRFAESQNVYFFLLLATHLNMQTERVQAKRDGAALFERLCGEVAERYFGGPNSETEHIVFGTGRKYDGYADRDEISSSVFGTRVNSLCKKLGEGYGFAPRPNTVVTAIDGKLDIVVWRKFSDTRPGQMIGFAQCKTGTHWQNDLAKLNPSQFCSDWLVKSPPVIPQRFYFVADRVAMNWEMTCSQAGLLFDRCRIVEYARHLSAGILDDVTKWARAAARSKGLRLP